MLTGGSFIGRERELATLEPMLASARPLTVTGPGGCGKSRMARELAARAMGGGERFVCQVVELATVRSADQVVSAVLRALGGRERGGRTSMQSLLDVLASRPLLLVLDNCEHLRTELGAFVGTLLDAAPEMRLLLTSREPIGTSHETVFQLGPLSLPGGGSCVSAVVCSDAGRLFVDRAVAINPAFALTPSAATTVVQICHELDGLPLALGLAAARTATMTLTDIADGLSRRGRLQETSGEALLPNHRSLRASLDWSYQLLDEQEQRLFRCLSAFAGGWTTSMAGAVALPEVSEVCLGKFLDSLEAKGLIVPTPGIAHMRWTFLQTVGEYSAYQLADDERDEIKSRHLARFRSYAAEADSRLGEPRAQALIDEEMPNLRLALEWSLEREISSGLHIVASLTRHWILSEHFDEAHEASAAVLTLAGRDDASPARALVHCGAGVIGMLTEDYEAAIANTQTGLALLADVDDDATRARCLQLAGMVLILTGLDLEEGLSSITRAVELFRASGDALGLGWALATVAYSAGVCDRFDAARTAYDEFVRIPGVSEHVRLRTWAEQAMAWAEVMVGSPAKALAHANLALELEGDWPSMTHFQGICHRIHALARLGRTDEALDEGRRAMTAALESGALQAVPGIELGLAMAEFMHGDLRAADTRARALIERVPQTHTLAILREVLAVIAIARGDASEAEAHGRELEAIAARTASSRHQALAEFVLGRAAILQGEPDRARDLLQSALVVYAELGLERGTTDVLDGLALLAANTGDVKRSARLAAAAAAARARLSCAPYKWMISHLEAVRGRIDRDARVLWDAAWTEGNQLSLAEAIAYARRARGPRDRPSAGWGSLTPAESEVAQLAAVGMSNPEIASQLFMSRSTVKMHLSSVYFKLGLANRTELARTIVTRSGDTAAAPGSAAVYRQRQ